VASAAKLLEKMRVNPRDWRIEDLKVVAKKVSIEYRQQGTSHVVFRHPASGVLTVPGARPIKPVYIRQFVAFVDRGESTE
jgi:predicted RNA binding protein YcfA (HicA-like mRNA interferase family)